MVRFYGVIIGIFLIAATAFSQENGTFPNPLASIDDSYAEAIKSGAFSAHTDEIDTLSARFQDQYDFLWRAARGYWAAGDYLYWQYTLDNIRSARCQDLDDIFAAEEDLFSEQGTKLIKLSKKGWHFAEQASAVNPGGIEGHFFHASSISIYALGKSILAALKEGLKGKFDKEIDTAISIDKHFLEGAPLRFKGRAYYKLPWPLRDYEDSRTLLSTSAEIGPEMPVTYIFLGDTLWKLGKKAAAIEAWKKTVDVGNKRSHEAVNKNLSGIAKLKITAAQQEL